MREVVDRVFLARIGVARVAGRDAALEVLARDARDALHRRHRDRVGALAELDEDRLRDRERERQPDRERGAAALRGINDERAAELLDLVVHDIHADAATRQLGQFARGREAALEHECIEVAVGQFDAGLEQAAFDRLAADRLAVHAATVVGHAQHDFGRFTADRDVDGTLGRLAGGLALLGRLDAVRERVAQHVLERRLHALEQVAVHFAVRAVDLELGALGDFVCGLAQRAAQVRHQRIEWHHARAHEAFLQVGTHARLLQQQGLGLARLVVEQVLDRDQVGHRLAERARELLQLREAVELERIEHALLVLLALVARDDLRFGFDLELSQLLAQSRDGLVELDEVEAEGRDLLFEARAVDRHLTRIVHERVEQVRTHADHFLRRVRDFFLFERGGQVARRRALRLFGRGCVRSRGGRWRRCRLRGECVRCLGGGLRIESADEAFEARDRMRGHRDRTSLRDTLHEHVQAIETAFERLDRGAVHLEPAFADGIDERLHRMAQVADRGEARHACAALERMQVSLQAGDRRAIGRRLAQVRDQRVGVVEDVRAFLHEDVEQVVIGIGDIERAFGLRIVGERRRARPIERRRGVLRSGRRRGRLERRFGRRRVGDRLRRVRHRDLGLIEPCDLRNFRHQLIGGFGRCPLRGQIKRGRVRWRVQFRELEGGDFARLDACVVRLRLLDERGQRLVVAHQGRRVGVLFGFGFSVGIGRRQLAEHCLEHVVTGDSRGFGLADFWWLRDLEIRERGTDVGDERIDRRHRLRGQLDDVLPQRFLVGSGARRRGAERLDGVAGPDVGRMDIRQFVAQRDHASDQGGRIGQVAAPGLEARHGLARERDGVAQRIDAFG